MTGVIPNLRNRSRDSLRTVCLLCGGYPATSAELEKSAAELGRAIALEGIHLVYGGSVGDLTGTVAIAAAECGGRVTAVRGHPGGPDTNRLPFADDFVIAPDPQARKRIMFDRADAFIALPGGVGAMEELAEIVALHKQELVRKPLLIANFGKFWNPLLDLLMYLRSSGFICGEALDSCLVTESPKAILPMLGVALVVDSQHGIANANGAIAVHSSITGALNA